MYKVLTATEFVFSFKKPLNNKSAFQIKKRIV